MKKSEFIKLKKILIDEIDRRNRVNELLMNDLIREFLSLNNIEINHLNTDDVWSILRDLLNEFEITESNGILVCINSYLTECSISYQDTNYYTMEVPFDNLNIEYQIFKDIETGKKFKAYTDKYIDLLIQDSKEYYGSFDLTPSEYCHTKCRGYLLSELLDKYIILNPYNTSINQNGYDSVSKDFFLTSIEKGQSKAKEFVLNKYSRMK